MTHFLKEGICSYGRGPVEDHGIIGVQYGKQLMNAVSTLSERNPMKRSKNRGGAADGN